MPQILEANPRRSASSQIAGGLEQFLGAFKQHLDTQNQRKEQAQALSQENEAIKRLTGTDVSGLSHDLKKEHYSSHLKGKQEDKKSFTEKLNNEREYNAIKSRFGDKVANLYRELPVGAKTEYIKNLFEQESRGISTENKYNPSEIENTSEPEIDEIPTKKTSKIIDYDQGKTPSERYKSQEGRYKTNLPLYQKSQEHRSSLAQEADLLNIMEELSPQIGTMERLNINPVNGSLLIPGLASPEAQRFVKTVNDFTRTAKDTYGSRVTNFDLTQFMKRLPTLANTEEGRRQILTQMKIINEINRAKEDALNEAIESHGGIRMIDYDRAEAMADKSSKKTIDSLKKQFSTIGRDQDNAYKKQIDDYKKIVPNGFVAVQRGDGEFGYIPKDKLKEFLEESGNKAL